MLEKKAKKTQKNFNFFACNIYYLLLILLFVFLYIDDFK